MHDADGAENKKHKVRRPEHGCVRRFECHHPAETSRGYLFGSGLASKARSLTRTAEAKKLLAQQEALEAVRKAKELEIKAKHERAQQKAALALAAASPAVKGPVDGPVQPAQASDDAVADSAPAPADADAATATTETGLQDLSLSDKGAGAAEAETGTDTKREDATA